MVATPRPAALRRWAMTEETTMDAKTTHDEASTESERQRSVARLVATSTAMLHEIEQAIDMLDPEMGWHEIVELRERLIRFRSSI